MPRSRLMHVSNNSGNRFAIRITAQPPRDDQNDESYGVTDFGTRVIELDGTMPIDERLPTLGHEKAEIALRDNTCPVKIPKKYKEQFCEWFGSQLAQFVREMESQGGERHLKALGPTEIGATSGGAGGRIVHAITGISSAQPSNPVCPHCEQRIPAYHVGTMDPQDRATFPMPVVRVGFICGSCNHGYDWHEFANHGGGRSYIPADAPQLMNDDEKKAFREKHPEKCAQELVA